MSIAATAPSVEIVIARTFAVPPLVKPWWARLFVNGELKAERFFRKEGGAQNAAERWREAAESFGVAARIRVL